MSFAGMDKIFGQVSADWSAPHNTVLEPFLFHVHPLQIDSACLQITVTDFQSNTFQATKSGIQLVGLRDAVGIGGSWSEFVDYVTASLKSEDVKLVIDGSSESGGALHAKLIAQKSKGMPRVSISLCKLVDGAACKAMGNLSRELYSEYKVAHNSLTEEKEKNHRLTKTEADEQYHCQEKNKAMQKQFDLMMYSKKHESHKKNDRMDLDNHVMVSQNSPGDRLDLETIRARKTVVERRSSFAGNNMALVDRGAYVSRDLARSGVPSGRLETACGSEHQAYKKTISSTKVLDSSTANDEGEGNGKKRFPEEVRKKTGEEELRHPKKNRVEDLGATSKNSHSKNIFVDGVNHRDKADSFWDLNDPEIGWKKGRSIVGDFDMIHLMSQSTDSFAHSLAWNSCQGLSLASAMRVREEKLCNDQNKLREEIVRLKEDNCRLTEEKKNVNVELLQEQRKFADKVKDFLVLEEKHSTELKTGGQFLASEAGKTFLKSIEDNSVQTFKASPAFREDVLDQAMTIHDDVVLDCRQQLRKNGVSEEIVMLIEPSVLEVDKVSNDDIPLDDAEMIEALIPRSVDDEA